MNKISVTIVLGGNVCEADPMTLFLGTLLFKRDELGVVNVSWLNE
jgi:hypothetical protein